MCIRDRLKPNLGSIIIDGKNVINYPIATRSKKFKIGYVPQYGGYFHDLSLIDNLKAKLLQTTLTQTSFGCYLTLFCRRFPDTFFGALGACGLYGEIAMGLVPFFSFAKLLLPIAMWGMHVSIAALQHIIFVDLLFFIPAWYIWHVIDRNPGKLRPLAHAQHPWDWTQWVDDIHACWLKARAFSQGPRLFQATPRESAAILDNNHLKDKNPVSYTHLTLPTILRV